MHAESGIEERNEGLWVCRERRILIFPIIYLKLSRGHTQRQWFHPFLRVAAGGATWEKLGLGEESHPGNQQQGSREDTTTSVKCLSPREDGGSYVPDPGDLGEDTDEREGMWGP